MEQKTKDFDYNYTIFEYFAEQHNLTLLDGEINDIIHLVNSALITQLQTQSNELQAAVSQYNAVVRQNKELQQELFQAKERLKPFADEYFKSLIYSEIAELAKKSIRLTKEHYSDMYKIEELQQTNKNLEEEIQNLFNEKIKPECWSLELKIDYYRKALEEIEEYQNRNCETCNAKNTKNCNANCQVFVILDIINKAKGGKDE